jgi:hypothetical protein
MAAAALATAMVAAGGGWLVRGTTAVPAAMWGAVAALALAVEAGCTEAGWLRAPSSREAARLVVMSLAVCPVMSILGAKRPQHGVWQFIVASLACVLALPAATAVLVRPGSTPDLHLIERCFLPSLVVVGWLNYVATRRSLAVSLVSVGQLGLMWVFLPVPWDREPLTPQADAGAAVLVVAGATVAMAQSLFWPVTSKKMDGLARMIALPFLALRETLGAAWTLRIAERFNAVAVERRWPCRVHFRGVRVDDGAAPGRWAEEAARCMRSLLRRFVSVEWIGRHAGADQGVAGSADLR